MNAKEVIEFIGNLTESELEEFNNDLVEKRALKVVEFPRALYGLIAVAYGVPFDEESEQYEFDVILTEPGHRFNTMKVLREVTDLSLVEVKQFVDSCPKVVKSEVSREEADNIAFLLTKAGASVEIK